MQTIFNIDVTKAGKSFEIDFQGLPEVSREYLIAYGLRQALNDVHASISLKAADKDGNKLYETEADVTAAALEAVEERIAKLQEGTMSLRAGGAPVDPVEAMRQKVVTELLLVDMRNGKVKVSGKPVKTLKALKEAGKFPAALAAKYGQKQAEIDKEVSRRMKEAAKHAADDVALEL